MKFFKQNLSAFLMGLAGMVSAFVVSAFSHILPAPVLDLLNQFNHKLALASNFSTMVWLLLITVNIGFILSFIDYRHRAVKGWLRAADRTFTLFALKAGWGLIGGILGMTLAMVYEGSLRLALDWLCLVVYAAPFVFAVHFIQWYAPQLNAVLRK